MRTYKIVAHYATNKQGTEKHYELLVRARTKKLAKKLLTKGAEVLLPDSLVAVKSCTRVRGQGIVSTTIVHKKPEKN